MVVRFYRVDVAFFALSPLVFALVCIRQRGGTRDEKGESGAALGGEGCFAGRNLWAVDVQKEVSAHMTCVHPQVSLNPTLDVATTIGAAFSSPRESVSADGRVPGARVPPPKTTLR